MNISSTNKGILYLIPSFIGETTVEQTFPAYNTEIINSLDEFIVEDEKTSRRALKKAGYAKPIDNINFHVYNEHTSSDDIFSFFENILKGKNIGLMSESGCPCVADPGALVVQFAHSLGVKVIPLIGPSSILLSLMASGFNGQNFTFNGYLPIDKRERIKKLKELEKTASTKNQTQIFIETPYRNVQVFTDIITNLYSDTLVCIACNISAPNGFILTKRVAEWKNLKPEINKQTTIFLIYK